MSAELTKCAPLQLEVFQVSSCLLQEDLSGNSKGITVELDFDIVRETERGLLGLSLYLTINSQEPHAVLAGTIRVLGLFKFSQEEDLEHNLKRLVGNGLVMMYGMVRGIIYEKASSLPPDLRILPTLNLVDLVNRKVEMDMSV